MLGDFMVGYWDPNWTVYQSISHVTFWTLLISQ